MRKYVIAVHGDNDKLHQEALEAAVEAVERVNKTHVYRAWIEKVDVPPPTGPTTERARHMTRIAQEDEAASKPTEGGDSGG